MFLSCAETAPMGEKENPRLVDPDAGRGGALRGLHIYRVMSVQKLTFKRQLF